MELGQEYHRVDPDGSLGYFLTGLIVQWFFSFKDSLHILETSPVFYQIGMSQVFFFLNTFCDLMLCFCFEIESCSIRLVFNS